jgi:hypothetical protein
MFLTITKFLHLTDWRLRLNPTVLRYWLATCHFHQNAPDGVRSRGLELSAGASLRESAWNTIVAPGARPPVEAVLR